MNTNIILMQSDTTAGFFSSNAHTLNRAKHSPQNKPLLQVLTSLRALPVRVPSIHRSFVRRARKTSFIYPTNPPQSYRVIQHSQAQYPLEILGQLYSTSANLSGKDFDLQWAHQTATIIIEDKRKLYQAPSSTIFKLSRTRKKRWR
ncbi:L-threonylcarbamoyladenylate synthase [Helicobacter cynogastricus]|uniref:N6-threonylcarbamoyl adenosine t(6)A37 modification in tRNA n=1 Tax=Helicobacter cynogastricus TaxID=329937 RepID=UPI001F3B64ED|nr:N6-threonylcarbamoyl adenosine t(6)A37 modification in tRNA [Helicobacter cynogastricus]